jgi:hypothetical protein
MYTSLQKKWKEQHIRLKSGNLCDFTKMFVSDGGTPSSHPFIDGFSNIKHPLRAWGTTIYGNLHMFEVMFISNRYRPDSVKSGSPSPGFVHRSHLLCAACRGGVESNAALMVDAEVGPWVERRNGDVTWWGHHLGESHKTLWPWRQQLRHSPF